MFCFFLPLLLSCLFANAAHGIGSTRVQCPEGHYLSRFSSAFDGSERFYKFGCSKFHGTWTLVFLEEKCESTEMAGIGAGADVYLSCGSDQYTVGVQIVEKEAVNGELWQFLCCRSESIQIRTNDCVDTKFINDFRRSSSFSSSAQVIRRWQAISENGDRRWWLQICPVDVILAMKKQSVAANEVRARREVPREWMANSRFPDRPPSLHPFFQRRTLAIEEERRKAMLPNKNLNSYAVLGRKGGRTYSALTSTPQMNTVKMGEPTKISVAEREEEEENWTTTDQPVDMPKLMMSQTTASIPLKSSSRLFQFNERIRGRLEGGKGDNGGAATGAMGKKNNGELRSQTADRPTEALDYYDMYDDNFDKAKHLGSGGILGGVTDFIQSLQDGLTLAQAVFPANVKFTQRNGPSGAKGFHLKIAVTPPTTEEEKNEDAELAFSRDKEVEEGAAMDSDKNNNLQIGSFLQQTEGGIGPKPRPPTNMAETKETRKETNTLESMLQMIGLCQGHQDL